MSHKEHCYDEVFTELKACVRDEERLTEEVQSLSSELSLRESEFLENCINSAILGNDLPTFLRSELAEVDENECTSATLPNTTTSSKEKNNLVMSPTAFALEAINIAVEQMEKNDSLWVTFVIMIDLHLKGIFSSEEKIFLLRGEDMEATEMGRKLKDISSNEVTRISLTWDKKTERFETFGIDQLHLFFEKVESSLEDLETALFALATPLNVPNAIQPKFSYVDSDTSGKILCLAGNTSTDKKPVLVIHGESGSGKSVFSCLLAKKYGYLPVYCVVEGEDFDQIKKFKQSYPLLDEFLRKAIILFEKSEEEKKDKKEKKRTTTLLRIKGKINKERNAWAAEMFDRILCRTLDNNDLCRSWLEGNWSEETKPNRVALIFDEATDTDLAEGMVAIGREKESEYSKTLVRNDLVIFLVGTGLDSIRYVNRVGTDASRSQLIRMKTPNIDALVKNSKISVEIEHAIKNGIFSRVMKTNARMFFRGVLPILELEFHVVDSAETNMEKEARLKERLTLVASFGPLMDFGARHYMESSTVGAMEGWQRKKLVEQAFLYHMEKSIRSTEPTPGEAEAAWRKGNRTKILDTIHNLELFRTLELDPSVNIFTRGIASREYTSKALKYLACFGLSCKLRPSFGNDFEELVALHYVRYMQVLGYETSRINLENAWPPAMNHVDINTAKSWLRDNLQDMIEGETFTLGDRGEWRNANSRKCFVFSQGRAQAQGGDILALVVDGTSACLDAIQCKHRAVAEGPKESSEYWSSLGIFVSSTEETTEESNKKIARAEWSKVGLDAFASLLMSKIGDVLRETRISEVIMGKRILALSFPTPTSRSSFPTLFQYEGAEVWFREMLEPTISLFQTDV